MSLPAWERGLKLCLLAVSVLMLEVAPRVGAWIETFNNTNVLKLAKSLPAWERGLKRKREGYLILPGVSLPAWERGLKQTLQTNTIRTKNVAPRVGAWIETFPVELGHVYVAGRSPRGSVD